VVDPPSTVVYQKWPFIHHRVRFMYDTGDYAGATGNSSTSATGQNLTQDKALVRGDVVIHDQGVIMAAAGPSWKHLIGGTTCADAAHSLFPGVPGRPETLEFPLAGLRIT
jgi:hypothetical protein